MLLLFDSPYSAFTAAQGPPSHPVSAAVDALVDYFSNAVPQLAAVRDDFPEHAQDLDLSLGSVLTIDSGLPDYELAAIASLDDAKLAGGGVQTMWRLGYWRCAMQIDLFSPYASHRDDLGYLIDQALHSGVPRYTGIGVDSPSYFNRPIIADVTGTFTESDNRGSTRGEWRRTWTLRVHGDLVGFGATPSIARLTLQLDTTIDGLAEATDTTTIIP